LKAATADLVVGSIGIVEAATGPPPSAAGGKRRPASRCAHRYGRQGTSAGYSKTPRGDACAALLWWLAGLGVSLPVSAGKRLARGTPPSWAAGRTATIPREGRKENLTVKVSAVLVLPLASGEEAAPASSCDRWKWCIRYGGGSVGVGGI
ncbi:unnamed protein product, partial [Ectocarpus sp. 13 AM-2016]